MFTLYKLVYISCCSEWPQVVCYSAVEDLADLLAKVLSRAN